MEEVEEVVGEAVEEAHADVQGLQGREMEGVEEGLGLG